MPVTKEEQNADAWYRRDDLIETMQVLHHSPAFPFLLGTLIFLKDCFAPSRPTKYRSIKYKQLEKYIIKGAT